MTLTSSMIILLIFIGCLYSPDKITAQYTTYGVDFYIGAFRFPFRTFIRELSITTLSITSVNFTVETGTGWNYTGNVCLNNPAIVSLPQSIVVLHGQYSQRYKGIHVYSDIPISVVMMFLDKDFNAEFLAYPYINFAIEHYKYYAISLETLHFFGSSLFLLVGTDDNTTVTIVPTQTIDIPENLQNFNSSTISVSVGDTYTVLLHKMQTFLVESNNDLSGTEIVSNNPLTVISGHECGIVSNDQWWLDVLWNHAHSLQYWEGWCSSVAEQIPPTVTWGKQFLFVPFPDTPYVTKVIASEGETTVKQTCNGTLDKIILLQYPGEWNFTFSGNDSYVYCAIESDKPILVSQLVSEGHIKNQSLNLSYIHETLILVPPVEQYINTLVYLPLHTSIAASWFNHHYIHITTTSTNHVLLDDKPYNWDWQTIHSDSSDIIGYGTVHEFNDTLPHVLRHSDITAGLSVIGYGSLSDFWTYGEGYTYLTGMNLNTVNTGVLQLNPLFGHILGGVPVIFTRPNTILITFNVYCVFDGIKVDGVIVSQTKILCVTPRLTKVGRVSVQLDQRKASFYSRRIEDESRVDISSRELPIYVGDEITLTWSSTSLTEPVQDIHHADLLVDIKLHIFQISNDIPTLEEVAKLDNDVANTGSATVKIPTIYHSSNQSVYAAIISIEVKGRNPTLFDKVEGRVTQWTDIIWIVSTNKQSSRTKLWSACKAWSISEPSSIGQQLLDKVRSDFPCPPTIGQARTVNSGLIEDRDTRLIKVLHPLSAKCFHQRTITMSNEGSGNQCCYGNNGNLIVGPTSGGSVDKVSTVASTRLNYFSNLIKHQFEDILPYIFCCKGTQTSCNIYYKRRPSDDGSAYTPPIPACVYGDPHIVTLDLHKYTFNGKGEFVLIETIDQSFTLQGRMIEVNTSSGRVGEATVFSACVAKEKRSSTVQFELDNTTSLIAFVDGERISFDELKSQEFDNVTITDSGNKTLNAIFLSGAFIQVQEQNGFISVLFVSLPERFKNKTQGLMGPYNGDKTDDLTPKGNKAILPLNSTIKSIHEEFGITWIINKPSDSLFTYHSGQSWSTFYCPDFTPVYEPPFNDPALEDKANEICRDDVFCKFDIAATGRVEIGETTYQGGQDFQQLVKLSKPITCNPSCVHGSCVDTNMCACGEGYEGDTCDIKIYLPCDPNPCNGGTCQYHAGNYICRCLSGFMGGFCEERITDICRFPPEVGPCRGLYSRWFFNATSSQCELFLYGGCQGNDNQFGTLNECIDHCGCLFGQPTKNCSLNVCSNSVCIGQPSAVCYPDICGDCSPKYFYGNDEFTNACGSRCEDGVQQVQCLHSPCDTAQCPNIPDAKCIPSSCGQCSAHFFNTSGHNVTSSCSSCPPDNPPIYCPINPCDHQNCSNYPDVQCVLDNCGQCQAKFIVNGTDITDQCKSCTVQGAIFKPCGATCIDTCSTRRMNSSIVCVPSCKPGCACPAGQIMDESSNRCVYPDQCSCPPCIPPPSNCSQLINDTCGCTLCRDCPIEGQVYQQNHTCSRTCSNSSIFCNVNVSRCSCPPGQLIDEDRNRCVHPFDCPNPNPCNQPPFTGPCRGAFPRYFYNDTSQKCEMFIYGGCNANDNNFFTLHECQQQCSTCPPTCSYIFCGVRRDAICSIPMESGVDCQSDNCTITNCQACYYSNNILLFPQLLPSCTLGCENPLDEECMKKWGHCVRRSFLKIYNKILPQDVVPENFHCWNHNPCL